jgi:large subunit ribosomal protein L13
MKTYLAKKETVQPKWHLIDAAGVPLGRLAVKAATLIRGRHKPSYTPSVDTGDFVVVINAEKVALTGKKEEQNEYMFFSGFVGGESYRKVSLMRERHPEFIIEHAVKGMLPEESDRGEDADEAPRLCRPRRTPTRPTSPENLRLTRI